MINQAPEIDDRPWLGLYAADLPAVVRPRHRDMGSLWQAAVAVAGDTEAIRYFDGSLTYAEVERLSNAFATWLRDMGVVPGGRVGIILQNVPHFIIATLAAWKLGAIPVPGNPMHQAGELSKAFTDYTPQVVICHSFHLSTVASALRAIGGSPALAVVSANDFQSRNDHRVLPSELQDFKSDDAKSFFQICREREGRAPPFYPAAAADIGLILYTSGTTGQPKGAMISHANLVTGIESSLIWMKVHQASRVLAIAPLFHIIGFVLHMGIAIGAQCSVGLHYRVHAGAVLDFIRSYRPTFTIGAITAFNLLMNEPDAGPADFASLETAFTGGAPVSPALRRAIQERLSLNLQPAYGMTETCSPTHISPIGLDPPQDPVSGALAVGVPTSSTEACIVGPDGERLGPGIPGEIWMRGPQIMLGYWNKPEETAKTLTDGWMRSGDIGCMDENGWFYVVDRKKDMISASGFKVWPREVEDALMEHPAVREAAVVGVPDPYRGETIRAFISIRGGKQINEGELAAHCRSRLAAYKIPRSFAVIDEIPKTATGKIQRNLLRELIES